MIFTYWTNPTIEAPRSAVVWRELYPEFTVFSDRDVLPLLPDQESRELYSHIALPAAKSDLARLLLLYQYGGLYLDAHTGPSRPEHLVMTMDFLSRYELVLFGKKWELKASSDFNLMNTAILGRAKSSLLAQLIEAVLQNLASQRRQERTAGRYTPYSLHSLTGTQVLIQAFFDKSNWPPRLHDAYKESVALHFMENRESPGFRIYEFYDYRQPGEHWSEREKREPLFI